MHRISRSLIVLAVAAVAVSACSVKKTERPALTGPSELGLSLNLQANPDILTQDGAAQSRIVVLALDQNGQPARGVPLHFETAINGVTTVMGLLSNVDATTGTDGRATVSYTAPPLPPDNVDHGSQVTIRVIPTGTDYSNTVPRTVNIRLVPPSVVPPAPTAAFSFSPTTPAPNAEVTFDGTLSQSSNGIATYSWDFGDGTTGTGAKPKHTFRAVGNFTVTLVIADSTGRTSYPCTQSVTVTTALSPFANFVFSPSNPSPNQTIYFNGSGSIASTGHSIVDYSWDFGNGVSSHGVTTTGSYSTTGTYSVTLVVKDDVGLTASKTQTVSVSASSGGSPVANFVFSPASPSPGQAVLFNAATSTAGTGRVIGSYAWNFGNGTTATGVTASATFAAAGTYSVVLVVTDDLGQTSSKSQAVTVSSSGGSNSPPTASFVFSPSSPAVGQQILFDASTSRAGTGRTIASYAWTFGDGSTATGRTYAKVAGYAIAGTYAVMLTITDDLGQSASTSQNVTIGTAATPTANFSVSPSPATLGTSVVVDASTSTTSVGQTIVTYEWNFGDSTTIFTTSNRTYDHPYTSVGSFTITLTVTDSIGRRASATKTITITP